MLSINKLTSAVAVSLCCLSLTNCTRDVPPPSNPVVVQEAPAHKAAPKQTDSKPATAKSEHSSHTSVQADNLNSATVNGFGN